MRSTREITLPDELWGDIDREAIRKYAGDVAVALREIVEQAETYREMIQVHERRARPLVLPELFKPVLREKKSEVRGETLNSKRRIR